MIKKIISGGQSGADLGGVRCAKKMGYDIEINVEKDYTPLKGDTPKNVQINIVSDKLGPLGGWIERRVYNIKNSDATLIFVGRDIKTTRGSLGTFNDAIRLGKPVKIIDIRNPELDKIREFLNAHKPEILNIAGQRDLEENNICNILKYVLSWER